jgi:hypothetical protein
MITQMQRRALLLIAEDLSDAGQAQKENVECLLSAYRIASTEFSHQINDPDPATILLGVQASALGIKTISNWLMMLGEEMSLKYYRQGKELWEWCQTTLDHYGIVMPDQMPL